MLAGSAESDREYGILISFKIMETGLTYTSKTTVGTENTAKTMGSGDLEVFATPAMAALMENAAAKAVAGELAQGTTTVGSLLEISHLRPSGMGEVISACATLTEAEGRKLTFKVVASDSKGVIGEGKHVRYIVDTERFLSKL